MRRTLLAVVPAVALLACNSGKAPPPAQASADPAATTASAPAPATPPPPAKGLLHLGAPITETKTVTLAELTKDPKGFENKTVTTSGTVFAVCQSMGCWMEIKDESSEAHVKLAGHSFFVPKTSAGHHARVQAKVMKTNPDEECSQEAAEQTGKPVAKLELEATGVELD